MYSTAHPNMSLGFLLPLNSDALFRSVWHEYESSWRQWGRRNFLHFGSTCATGEWNSVANKAVWQSHKAATLQERIKSYILKTCVCTIQETCAWAFLNTNNSRQTVFLFTLRTIPQPAVHITQNVPDKSTPWSLLSHGLSLHPGQSKHSKRNKGRSCRCAKTTGQLLLFPSCCPRSKSRTSP